MNDHWIHKPVSLARWLEAVTFMLALFLYGWASDRSQEPLVFVGWMTCGVMYLRSMMLRDEEV